VGQFAGVDIKAGAGVCQRFAVTAVDTTQRPTRGSRFGPLMNSGPRVKEIISMNPRSFRPESGSDH
jgi:hypothetical protein